MIGKNNTSRDASAEVEGLVFEAVEAADSFVGLTASGPVEHGSWEKARARPVEIKGVRALQIIFTGSGKNRTDTVNGADLRDALKKLVGLFTRFHLQSTVGDAHIRVTSKGRVLISRGQAGAERKAADLSHDRRKNRALPSGGPDAFLIALEIMNPDGSIRPSMQAKYRQINAFIELLKPVIEEVRDKERPLRLVDCGCGSAYLTFALYHYLKNVLHQDVRVVGVDRNEELVEKTNRLRDRLGWGDLSFRVANIGGYQPGDAPDLVLSLHACDTATDEALAQGVRWGSRGIVAAPCCQHELHRLLDSEVFNPVLRHGILRERLADLLTDTFRALALQRAGYRTKVIEFVSPEFTPKNLMIQAVKTDRPVDPGIEREYLALKKFWNVTPAIESMLGGC